MPLQEEGSVALAFLKINGYLCVMEEAKMCKKCKERRAAIDGLCLPCYDKKMATILARQFKKWKRKQKKTPKK